MQNRRKRNKLPNIRGVFFDLGGVLVKIDTYFSHLVRVERDYFHVSQRAFQRAIHAEEGKLEKDQESQEMFWRLVARHLGVPPFPRKIARSILRDYFKRYAGINKKTLAIALRLRRAGYPIGVISNTINDHTAEMKRWKLFEYFDPVILSNEVRTRKPERKIFMLAAKRMGISPQTSFL